MLERNRNLFERDQSSVREIQRIVPDDSMFEEKKKRNNKK